MRRDGRLKGSVVILVLGLLMSACIVEPETRFCACPNLETVAPTIDWMGTGQLPEIVDDSSPGSRGLRHRVALHYESTNALGDLAVAVQRLTDAGFRRTDDSNQSFRGEEWLLILGPGGTVEQPLVILFVDITDDERAAEILQPLMDALGTVP